MNALCFVKNSFCESPALSMMSLNLCFVMPGLTAVSIIIALGQKPEGILLKGFNTSCYILLVVLVKAGFRRVAGNGKLAM